MSDTSKWIIKPILTHESEYGGVKYYEQVLIEVDGYPAALMHVDSLPDNINKLVYVDGRDLMVKVIMEVID